MSKVQFSSQGSLQEEYGVHIQRESLTIPAHERPSQEKKREIW
jgi:hypothetical protein